jgi:phage terminase large subunit
MDAKRIALQKRIAEEAEKQRRLKDTIGKGYDEFWEDKHRYRVLKGGRGSKKSTTTALWFIWNIMKYPLANAVVIRKTFNTHKDSTHAQLKWAASKLGVLGKWDFTKSPLEATYMPTGQKILFRGFDDPLKLTSMTVAVGVLCWVWLEEAYEIDKVEDFDTFDESIRGEMPPGYWKQITITYNPWINSHWTKSRYWDGECPDNVFRLTTTHKCNEFLDKADHDKIEALQYTDPERYKVVGLGEYGIPGGAYFNEFRTDIHTINTIVIPFDWRRYITIDYGLDMLAAYWIAVDAHNKAYVYKELYQSGLIISDAAKAIKKITNETIYQTFAPPDLWNKRQETGKSAADLFRENGVNLVQANNERVQGWYNLKEWLKPYEDEQGITTASLVIFRNCVNLIRCLPQLQCDEKDPNDVATEPHELTHAPDAIRYFISGRPKPQIIQTSDIKQGGTYAYGELKLKGYNDAKIKFMQKNGTVKVIGVPWR